MDENSVVNINANTNNHNRFSDLAGEPCKMLEPIAGYENMPLVSLADAIVPLKPLVRDIEGRAWMAKERCKKPADNLSWDESAAITLYTMEWDPYNKSLYYILNSKLRDEERSILKPWFSFLKLILTGLSRLPSIHRIVYRGVKLISCEDYQIGNTLIWWGFSSCSMSEDIAKREQFLGSTGTRSLFVIECSNGKEIERHSFHRKEQEVLLLPGTRFKVVRSNHRADGFYIIELKEIDSPYPLLKPVSTSATLQQTSRPPTTTNTLSPSAAVTPAAFYNPKLREQIARFRPKSEVYLIGKRLSERDLEIIVQEVIVDRQCKELYLRESAITPTGAAIIADALRNNVTLEKLYIFNNRIGNLGAQYFAEALTENNNLTLKILSLGWNGITDDGVEHLATMLETNKTLTQLWLPWNQITIRGMQLLANVLASKNSTLQLLCLNWNKLESDDNIEPIVKMLEKNRSLTQLNLRSRHLSRPKIRELKAMAKNKKGFELDIS